MSAFDELRAIGNAAAGSKECSWCHEIKPESSYYKRTGGKGLFAHCKDCDNRRRHERAQKDRESNRERMRGYVKKHREKKKQYVELLEKEVQDQHERLIAMTIALLSVSRTIVEDDVPAANIQTFITDVVQKYGVKTDE